MLAWLSLVSLQPAGWRIGVAAGNAAAAAQWRNIGGNNR